MSAFLNAMLASASVGTPALPSARIAINPPATAGQTSFVDRTGNYAVTTVGGVVSTTDHTFGGRPVIALTGGHLEVPNAAFDLTGLTDFEIIARVMIVDSSANLHGFCDSRTHLSGLEGGFAFGFIRDPSGYYELYKRELAIFTPLAAIEGGWREVSLAVSGYNYSSHIAESMILRVNGTTIASSTNVSTASTFSGHDMFECVDSLHKPFIFGNIDGASSDYVAGFAIYPQIVHTSDYTTNTDPL